MKKQKAFTLIEILVVIAILGILVTIVTAIGLKGRERARRAAALQFSATVYNTLGAYLMGEWKFDEGTDGVVATGTEDTSGNDNDGTIRGNPIWKCADADKKNTPSGRGCSLDLNGTDDYVEVDNFNINGLESFAATGWVNTGDDTWMVVSKGELDGKYFYFYFYSSYILGFSITGLTDTNITCDVGSGFFKFGEWHFLVANYSGSEIAIYLDGKEACQPETSSGTADAGNELLRMGAYTQLGGSYRLDGLIDEVRIYEEALTSAQIQKLYAEGAEKHGLLVKE